MHNTNLDSFTVDNSTRNKTNTAILCLLIILLGNLIGAAAAVDVQLEKVNKTGVLLAGNTQDGCHVGQNYAMIVEDLSVIYENSKCNIPVKVIDWSDSNQKQLLVDVRKSCNGQRKCLLNGNILTADCEGNSVKPERFNVTYSCYTTSPDNKTVFDITEVKTKKYFQNNEVFYLSLQPRNLSQTSHCTVKAENTLHVDVIVLSSNTNLQIRCQEKLQYLNDSKTFSKISCVNAKHMSFTVFSEFFTLMQIIVQDRDTMHIVCDTKDISATSTDELNKEKMTSRLILICASSVCVICITLVIVISVVCIHKRKRKGNPSPATKPYPASHIVVTPAPGLAPAYSLASATNKVFDPAPSKTFKVTPYLSVELAFETTPVFDPAVDPAVDPAPVLNDVYSHLSHLTQRNTETENVYNG